jgi:hypothetical protein
VSARIIAPSLSFQFRKGKRREAELGLTWNTCVDLWLCSQIIAKKVLYMLTLVVLRVDGFVVYIEVIFASLM